MKILVFAFVCTACVLMLAGPLPAQTGASGYHLIDSCLLGGEGGWDYLAVDPGAGRLYVSRGMRVQVIDLVKRAVVGELAPTPGVHGIAIDAASGKGYTSNGRDSSVTEFDLKTLATVRVIKVGARNPDAILFEPFTKRVFTFNGGSGNATAVETETGVIAGMVPLGGKPEFAVADGQGRVYVNLEDKSTLVEFDARTLKVLNAWPIAPGEEASGLAIDRENRWLFAGCSNNMMVVVDAGSGKVVETLPIGSGVDATAYDPVTHLAFSSNGEGTLTVVRVNGREKPALVENVATRRGARTMAVDEKTHLIYVVSGKFGPPPAPTADRPHPRPVLEPGSVTLYILGR